ncbi:MAG: hypothetical protein ACPL6F_01045 [Anaerolineales bacterium]
MPKNQQSDPCCANFIARSIFNSFEEILGQEEFRRVLELANLAHYLDSYPPQNTEKIFPLQDLKAFFETILTCYGEQSSRGLILRSGRTWFNRLYHQPSPSLGLSSLEFITLPKKLKQHRGAQILAGYFSRYTDWQIKTSVEGAFVVWQLETSSNENNAFLKCFMDLFLGFWQEALYWISGGKTYIFDPLFERPRTNFLPAQICIPTIPID